MTRSLGQLPAGWRSADLIQFERELADLRDLVVEGRTPPVRRVVTLREFAGPWFEQIARQVEVGRMSPYEREVPLYDGLGRLLASRQASLGWVFTDPSTGEPWEYSRPAYVFLRKAYEDAGLRRPGVMRHALRHTYASVLAAGGVKRHELEKLMGHARQGTTGIYTHLVRESYETVQAALDAVFAHRPNILPL